MNGLTSLVPSLVDEYVASVDIPGRMRENGRDHGTVHRCGAYVASVIQVYPTLDRAMDKARDHIRLCEQSGSSVANGTLILASSLSLPKGRFSRSWHAPPGGLWGCLILADTFLSSLNSLLPLVPGIAACEALHQEGVSEAAIRWVNDVLVAGKKQAGFLVEGFRSPVYGENFHLLGFGLNINNNSFPPELQETAVSLAQVLGRQVDICSFTLSFLARLRYYFGLLLYDEERWAAGLERDGKGNEHPVVTRWKELSDTLGRRVLYGYDVLQHPQYEAVVTGVGADGALLLRHDDGSTSVEHSGEIRYC